MDVATVVVVSQYSHIALTGVATVVLVPQYSHIALTGVATVIVVTAVAAVHGTNVITSVSVLYSVCDRRMESDRKIMSYAWARYFI
jgi:hypothetical protein